MNVNVSLAGVYKAFTADEFRAAVERVVNDMKEQALLSSNPGVVLEVRARDPVRLALKRLSSLRYDWLELVSSRCCHAFKKKMIDNVVRTAST
jgi:hypothetical protein